MIEKWAAGFSYNGNVKVVKARFRKTPKLMKREKAAGDEEERAAQILRYKSQFTHKEADMLLFDTPQEALDAMHQRYEEMVEG